VSKPLGLTLSLDDSLSGLATYYENVSTDHSPLVLLLCTDLVPPSLDDSLAGLLNYHDNVSTSHSPLVPCSCTDYVPPSLDDSLAGLRNHYDNVSTYHSLHILIFAHYTVHYMGLYE